jgi:hypothetical protein
VALLAVSLWVVACASSETGTGGDGGRGGLGGLGGSAGAGGEGGGVAKCNGSADFCDRRFDEVSYPMTHNAMSNAEDGWNLPNQNFNIVTQLEAGIRGMMLDTYDEDGEIVLCHVLCGLGSKPLVDALTEIRVFLDENPGEVFSIIFESYIENSETAAAVEESGLIDLTYAHTVGEPWPTLAELIEANTRVMVFQEKPGDEAYPWLMYFWEHAWETPFSFATPEDFSCDPNRGDPEAPLFLLNHFLTSPLGGSSDLAEMVNYNPLFLERAEQCEEEGQALPNFVAVDFYDIGDLFGVTQALNSR